MPQYYLVTLRWHLFFLAKGPNLRFIRSILVIMNDCQGPSVECEWVHPSNEQLGDFPARQSARCQVTSQKSEVSAASLPRLPMLGPRKLNIHGREVEKTFAAGNRSSCAKGKGDLQQNTRKLLMCQLTSAL